MPTSRVKAPGERCTRTDAGLARAVAAADRAAPRRRHRQRAGPGTGQGTDRAGRPTWRAWSAVPPVHQRADAAGRRQRHEPVPGAARWRHAHAGAAAGGHAVRDAGQPAGHPGRRASPEGAQRRHRARAPPSSAHFADRHVRQRQLGPVGSVQAASAPGPSRRRSRCRSSTPAAIWRIWTWPSCAGHGGGRVRAVHPDRVPRSHGRAGGHRHAPAGRRAARAGHQQSGGAGLVRGALSRRRGQSALPGRAAQRLRQPDRADRGPHGTPGRAGLLFRALAAAGAAGTTTWWRRPRLGVETREPHMARRKQGEAGATRDAVLDAAESGFRLGRRPASVESIAAQAGWSRGAASYHFRGKPNCSGRSWPGAPAAAGPAARVAQGPVVPRCWLRTALDGGAAGRPMPGTSSASWPGPMTMRMTTRAYAARRPWDCASSACCARCCGRAEAAGELRLGLDGHECARLLAAWWLGAAASCVATPYRSGVAARPRYARSLGAACADRTAGPGRRRGASGQWRGRGPAQAGRETYLLWRRQGGAGTASR